MNISQFLKDKYNLCTGCFACANSCPVDCIEMVENNEGFVYPNVEETKCLNCNQCVNSCPLQYYTESVSNVLSAYAAKNSNKDIRFNSSSGGIFTLIAEKIINDGGVVFGAAFSNEYNSVRHIYVDTIEDLYSLRNSKYVQSSILDSYKNTKCFLEKNFKVLFSGTPCQIAGLKSFLNKEYENLLCIDLICHGVPSPKIWDFYIGHLKESIGAVKDISFRDKSFGWSKFSLKISGIKNTYLKTLDKDKYMQIFLNNRALRMSCYNCFVKDKGSNSDITLGDFWGINSLYPEFDDDNGVSAVIIHSLKGMKIFNSIMNIDKIKVELDDIVKNNYAYNKSVNMPRERNRIFEDIDSMSFEDFLLKYGKPKRITLKEMIASTSLWKLLKKTIRRSAL